MTPEWFTAWATAIGAGATLLAVVAALVIAIWGDWLKSLTSRPKLSVSISMTAPDCHKIQTTGRMQLPGTAAVVQVAAYDTYYCRLSVGNEGTAAARNVSVRALRLSRLDANGAYESDPYFMPMNLTWSHAAGSTEAGKIDPSCHGIVTSATSITRRALICSSTQRSRPIKSLTASGRRSSQRVRIAWNWQQPLTTRNPSIGS